MQDRDGAGGWEKHTRVEVDNIAKCLWKRLEEGGNVREKHTFGLKESTKKDGYEIWVEEKQ